MQETKYTKKLYKAIRKLNLGKEELKQMLLCLYINGCSSEDCIRLFGADEDRVIKYLKSEELYGYKACSKCGKLRDRKNEFRQCKNQKNLICKMCEKQYDINHHKKYYKNNKEKKKKYNESYYENNKEKMRPIKKKYYENNKEKMRAINKKYQQSSASIEYVRKLARYEEVSGNQIRCKYCGRWMNPTIIQVTNRLRGIKENDRCYIYCSEECKQECPTYGQKLHPKGFKHASSREVNPVLRQVVLKRDNYTCQKCGKFENVKLHCHHIIPHINSPLETNDPDNCITLCKDCHKEVHKIPGCGFAELKCNNKD